MDQIREFARNVLNDISVGNHIDIVCEPCEGFEDVFILKIATAERYAIFDIINERLKIVSLSSYQGFSEQFVRQFQNYMIDELYCR